MGLISKLRGKKTPITRETTAGMMDSMQRVTARKTTWQWGDKNPFIAQLTKTDLKKYYWGNEIVFHGFNKKARDLTFDWFEADNPEDGETIPESIEKQINQFVKEKQVKLKTHTAVLDSLKTGNGWIEYICEDTGNWIPTENGLVKDSTKPIKGKLLDIAVVNPDTIIDSKLDETETFVEYWIQKIGTNKIPIHHTRLYQFAFYRDGDKPFGISPLEVCRSSIKADNETLEASAKNYDLFGSPLLTVNTTDNQNRKQVDDAFDTLGRFKRKLIRVGLAGFKDTKFGLLNPGSPNLLFGVNNFYVHLAAALEIPMMLLIGEQKGKLTGSEVELNDYYKSIAATQTLHITPFINNMFKLLLGSWENEIQWNPLFVDEKTDIANKALIIDKFGDLYSKHGGINIIEFRQLLREHGIPIPEDGELDELEEAEPEPEPAPMPSNEDEDDTKSFRYHYATDEEKKIADELRKLGIRELIAQDERCR